MTAKEIINRIESTKHPIETMELTFGRNLLGDNKFYEICWYPYYENNILYDDIYQPNPDNPIELSREDEQIIIDKTKELMKYYIKNKFDISNPEIQHNFLVRIYL